MVGGGTSKSNNQVEQDPRIVLCIKSQDGDTSFYRIARDKKMQNLFFTYCKEKNLDYNAVKFFCDGKHIKAMKTPVEAGLEDGDEIDAMVHQDGGGHSGNTSNPKSI